MKTTRFGRKIKLSATVAIKHQIRMLMARDINNAETELIVQANNEQSSAITSRSLTPDTLL
jgi:hypothetical protein